MKRLIASGIAAAALFTLAACENLPYSRQTQGAAIGAAAGGLAGHAVTDSAVGTAIGAAAGGVAGSEVGRRQDAQRR